MTHDIYNPAIRRGGKLPEMPKFKSLEDQQRYNKLVLVNTCRIFADLSISDGIGGYIVYRDVIDKNTYWVNPMGVDLSMVTVDDLLRVNWDGIVIEGNYPASQPAWASFTAIGEHRPEINAAVHFHTKFGSTWSSFGLPIDYVTEDTAAFYKNLAVYNNFNGALLTKQDGIDMLKSLRANNSIILQNHGIYTVGETLDEAAWRFLSLEKACEMQITLETLKGSGIHPKNIPEDTLKNIAWMMGRPYACWLQYQPILKKYMGEDYEVR